MTDPQANAVLTICLMAAFADGAKDEREREQIRRIAESLSAEAGLDLAARYQEVLLGRARLSDAAAALGTPEQRQLAYEMAVCVCDADGARNGAETRFLAELRSALGIDEAGAEGFAREADAVAAAPLAPPAAAPLISTLAPAEMDKMILNASILNGALELLPESLASMAIIPLQMRLVYRVGRSYGFELDRGHVRDFLATLGVGLTSQYVEQIGRKLVGGLLGKLAGRLGGAIGRQATGSAFSFASTYALGHVAKRYYGGGRKLDGATLKSAFEDMLGEARGLQARYMPEIEQKARSVDVAKLLAEVRAG